MDSTELGIVISVRDSQYAKAWFPMDLTELGIIISVKDSQYTKA